MKMTRALMKNSLIDDNKGDNDQNVTMSVVACPLPPKDTQQELKALIDKLAGRSGALLKMLLILVDQLLVSIGIMSKEML